MAFGVRATSSNSAGSGTAVSVSAPTGTTAGDLVVIFIHGNNQTTFVDNNGSTPFQKDLADYKPNPSYGQTVSVFTRRIKAGDPTTFNFTMGTTGRWAIIAYTIQEPNNMTIYDVAPTTYAEESDNTVISAPSINTLTDGALHIAMGCLDDGSVTVIDYPAGYGNTVAENDQPMGTASKIITTAGATGSQEFEFSGSSSRIGVSVAIKPPTILQIENVGSATADGSGTAISVTPPSGIQAGDVIIAVINCNGVRTVADNNGATPFTNVLIDRPYNTNSAQGHILSRIAGASEPGSYAWTMSASDRWAVIISVYRGVDTTDIFDVDPTSTTENIGTGLTSTTDGITIGANDSVVIAIAMADNNTFTYSTVPPHPFYTRENNPGQQLIALSDRYMAIAGSQSAVDFVMNTTGTGWLTNIFSLKKATIPTSDISKITGITLANVKKMSGIAKANIKKLVNIDN